MSRILSMKYSRFSKRKKNKYNLGLIHPNSTFDQNNFDYILLISLLQFAYWLCLYLCTVNKLADISGCLHNQLCIDQLFDHAAIWFGC